MTEKKSIPFKEGLFEFPEGNEKAAHILGVRCNACGKYAFPPRPICISCHSKNVVTIPLSRKGKLHSFTICRVPVPKMSPPYAIGYIDLPEGVRPAGLQSS
ncbi:MAG: OB-fold domain-containing protein [Deltaproteobacteria bacterium]|nr:OB-fold domain-containing protein [Deltaproteobacteria bacterium]